MFKKFGDFLKNVQQDIQTSVQSGRHSLAQKVEDNINRAKKISLSSIKTDLETIAQTVTGDASALNHCSIDAGTELIARFEKEWIEIRVSLGESAHRAKAADELLSAIVDVCQGKFNSIKSFQSQMSTLSIIALGLDSVKENTIQLGKHFGELEKALDDLEGLCDEIDAQKAIISEHHLAEAELKRQEDLRLKNELKALSEKRQIYSEQAAIDIKTFKERGVTPQLVEAAKLKKKKLSAFADASLSMDVPIDDLIPSTDLDSFYSDNEESKEGDSVDDQSRNGEDNKNSNIKADTLYSITSENDLIETSTRKGGKTKPSKVKVAPLIESPLTLDSSNSTSSPVPLSKGEVNNDSSEGSLASSVKDDSKNDQQQSDSLLSSVDNANDVIAAEDSVQEGEIGTDDSSKTSATSAKGKGKGKKKKGK